MSNLAAVILSVFSCAAVACGQPAGTGKQAPAAQVQAPAPAPELKPKVIAPRPAPDPSKFAVIISGISGEEAYAKQFGKWSADLRAALVERLAFAEDHVTLLTEKPADGDLKSTAAEVRKAFAALKSAAGTDHSVFVFFIGHGTSDGKESKFNLVGPDISATEYAALIKAVPARRVVVVNMASASGDFIKPLSGAGHVTVTATRNGQEQNATHFAEYFIQALGSPEADTDKNGRISVLEAFDFAAKQTARFYETEKRLATEHPIFDDNGDGVGHDKPEAGDGSLAKATFFDSLPAQQAGGDAELKKLFDDRARLEAEVEQLKSQKEQMKADEYEAALEKLLLQLAELNQKIQARQK